MTALRLVHDGQRTTPRQDAESIHVEWGRIRTRFGANTVDPARAAQVNAEIVAAVRRQAVAVHHLLNKLEQT